MRHCRLALLFAALLPPLAPLLARHAIPHETPVRVMSYNIHHGEGIDGKLDLERIAKLIIEARVDVVGLQEVDRGVERTGRRDLPAELARLTGLAVVFERNIFHQGGEYGNAVLSRFPVKRSRNTHYAMLRPGEQRGLQQLVLEIGGRDVLFLNTHLDFRPDHSERLLNVDEIKAAIAAAGPMPVILVGDLNTLPASPPHQKLEGFLTDAWTVAGQGPGFTIPVLKPSKRIDYIFVSRETVEPVKMEVLHSIASDHLPIVAELRIR
jgi:endonuclease/exonuclease/phosphatase family metal-dependent hydrolase